MVRYTGNTIALSPPLIIEKNQIDNVFDVLSNSIKKCQFFVTTKTACAENIFNKLLFDCIIFFLVMP